MKKNDKIIVVIGVIILILASIGIYFWVPEKASEGEANIEKLVFITGNLKEMPKAITVDDSCPFYPIIATPLAVNYNEKEEQNVIPLYVANFTNPSSSIIKVKQNLEFVFDELAIDGSKSAKQESLMIAKKYWDHSDAVLIIKDDQSGYELGVIATPIASYLRIPIIVTDSIDQDVSAALRDLKVKYSLVCGDNIDSYGSTLKFDNVEDIVNMTIYLLEEKFKTEKNDYDINYITLTNPIDAWPPKVLDSVEFSFGPKIIKSSSQAYRGTIKNFMNLISGAQTTQWKFTIPEDYKYALIELDGYNHEIEGVYQYADNAKFDINPVDNTFFTLGGGGSTAHGIPTLDEKGNVIEDKVHNEIVLYDCGGQSYTLTAGGSWVLKSEGKVSAKITIKKLDSTVYPSMKNLSSIAPYLTSYHKGIIFGKTEFAFTANDDIITNKGETCPGFYLPGRNPELVTFSNKHVYDKIHQPFNKLLAKLADIPYDKPSDLKSLTEYYKDNPLYVALVGDATVLPSYLYQNEVEPIGDIDGDGTDDSAAKNFGGGGTDSDNIYGNIDPVAYDWSNEAKDIYSEYPYLENIVGRITGWDVQDADALIVRTIFYDKIIDTMTEWKENFGNLNGGGTDFQKPLLIQVINHIPVIKQILKIIYQATGGFIDFYEGPWKLDTGFSEIMGLAIENKIGEDLGFKVETAFDVAAMIDGYSNEDLDKIKNLNLNKKLTFSEEQVKALAGEGNVKGRDILENSNFIWITGHGCPYNFGMDGPDLVASGNDGIILNAPKIWQNIWKNWISPYLLAGFLGPGSGLGKVGEYTTRLVSTIDFGPSFIWIESCTVGKIRGIYTKSNVAQSFLHSGVNALIASTTGSNIPGGYLEPKNHMYDTILSTKMLYNQWMKKAKQGEFPDFHFAFRIYDNLCHSLKNDDASIGLAFRDAKNSYLPEDADWELWWSPPLSASSSTSSGFGPHLSAKYTSFQEYVLYGDPAFNPYVP